MQPGMTGCSRIKQMDVDLSLSVMDMQTRALSQPGFLIPRVCHGRAELPCCRSGIEDGGLGE